MRYVFIVGLLLAGGCKGEKSADKAQSASSETKAVAAGVVKVTVDNTGYKPTRIEAKAGEPLTVEFTRTTETVCGERVVFKGLGIEKDLPLNQPVAIQVTPKADGPIHFACGMDMMKGAIVASQ